MISNSFKAHPCVRSDELSLHGNVNEKSLSDESNNILEADNTEECTEVQQKKAKMVGNVD